MRCLIPKLREERGWSQSELARRSNLSRQLIHNLELNKTFPSIQTAFRLAHTFGCKIESLFEDNETTSTPKVPVQSITPELAPSSRVNLAKVGGKWIAFPTDSSSRIENGFSATDGILDNNRREHTARMFTSPEEAEKHLVIAGCDPALQLIREMLAQTGKIKAILHSANSNDSLHLLRKKMVHIAGVHFDFCDTGNPSRSMKKNYPKDVEILRYSTWEQGWIIRPGNPKNFKTIDDLTRPDIRFASREEGSGTRTLLNYLLSQSRIKPPNITPKQKVFSSHLSCAREVAKGRADVALSLRAIATSLHLDFIPIAQVNFDLLIPKNLIQHPSIQAMGNILHTQSFRQNLASIPGYRSETSGTLL